MKIYKVRFLDELGKEIAEFGFYEDLGDAERRRAEVASRISQRGSLEIRTIVPTPPSEFVDRRIRLDTEIVYELKEGSKYD